MSALNKKHAILLAIVASILGCICLSPLIIRDRELSSRNQPWTKKLIDPESKISKEDIEERNDIVINTVAEGKPYFRVHPRADDGMSAEFIPSSIMIEVLNPNPECEYSVTIQSHNFYTGTARLLAEGQITTDACKLGLRQCHRIYSWKPILPGQYDVLVHEIGEACPRLTPLILPPLSVTISEWTAGAGMTMFEDRILNMPPCQTVKRDTIFSRWEGDWLGPDIQLENSIRTGWTFLPSSRMACKLETFDAKALRLLHEINLYPWQEH